MPSRADRVRLWLTAAAVALASPALADFELTAPDGRRILLKDDRTWQYVLPKDEKAAEKEAEKMKEKELEKEKEAARIREEGEAVLLLEGRLDAGSNCQFVIDLVNNLRYPIRSLVPQFTATNASGAVLDTVFSGFSSLKPGDRQRRQIMFRGVACGSIARLQVVGGDRCDMGDLNRFSDVKGQCLARVRVVASELVRFDK